jgi:predicted dehydrogenase
VPTVTLAGPLGFGHHYRARLAVLAAQGRARLGAVVDHRDPGALEDVPDGTPWFESLEGNLASPDPSVRPDVVIVSTPMHTHRALAETALRAGCDVMLEKPPTPSAADHAALLDVVRETGRLCQVGFQTFGSTALDTARQMVADGVVGEVRHVGTVGSWTRTRAYWERSAWAGKRRVEGVDVVDGVVTNPLAHAVVTALELGGVRRSEQVASVEVDLYRANPIEADDTSSVLVRSVDGPTFSFALTLCAPVRTPARITVYGSQARLVLYYETDRIEVHRPEGVELLSGSRVPLLDDLLDARRRGDGVLRCPLEATGAFTQVLEAVRTAPDPRPVPEALVAWTGEGDDARPVVSEVEAWSDRVADGPALFRDLGAPWARVATGPGGPLTSP